MKFILTDTQYINETLKKAARGDTIYLTAGIYHEKVEILTDGIILTGDGADKTIITNHDFYHKIMPDYNECNTFRTYTCYVGADNVTISGITVENSSVPSRKYGQAVALHVDGNHFYCYDSILKSAQDTLFTGPLPMDLVARYQGFLPPYQLEARPSVQHYKNCTIQGDVDFIFGGATALFEDCEILTIYKEGQKSFEANSYICAPSHAEDTPFGYLFYRCHIAAEPKVSNVYLGRPWRDYGCAAFIDCTMGNHIHKLGFNKWNHTERDKTARFYEYGSYEFSEREPWVHRLTAEQARQYVSDYFNFIEKAKK